MKIRSVAFNNKRKDFEVKASGKKYTFLTSKLGQVRHPTIKLPERVWTESSAAKVSSTNFNQESQGPST